MWCEKCGVHVKTETNDCPLCKHRLQEDNIVTYLTYPSLKRVSKVRKIFERIFAALMISCIIISGIINYATFELSNSYWSLIVIFSCLSLLFIYYRCKRKWHEASREIFYSSIFMAGLLICIDMFSKSNILAPSWSLDYTLPIIMSVSLLTCSVFIFIKKSFFKLFYGYTLLLCIINILLFFRLGYTNIKWPIIVSVSLGVLVLISSLIVLKENIKDELQRKFHA